MTTDLSNLKFETEWANHLGGCMFWLPESLRSQIGQQNDPAFWADAYEITGFLRILTLIAEERYDDSLNAVIQHFDESDFQGELFLLRARIHLLLDQFDKIPACFEGAAAYGASDDLINSTYNEISKELDSRNQRPDDQLAPANELQELNEHLDLLPSELKAEALKNPSERVLNEELNAFLGILGCLMNGEFEVALNLVRSHFENTAYPGHLFLIRSRIHMLQDDFDSARIALAGAQEFGVSDQVIEMRDNNLTEDGETVTADKGSCVRLAEIDFFERLASKLARHCSTDNKDRKPNSWVRLGDTSRTEQDFVGSAYCYARALMLERNFPYAKGYLAFCLAHACFWEGLPQLLDEIKNDIELDLRVIDPFSSFVLLNDLNAQRKSAEIFTRDRFAQSPSLLWTGEAYSHDRTRVGYLSADYHEHATSYLMAELFESHDKDRFETYAISFGKDSNGPMRQRLVKAFDHFIDVRDQSDREVAEMMRELEIDIAIDLKGYTADARPGILSHRPCPVQAQYLRFPGTMGAPYIDYIIADDVIIPESHEQYYTEKVIRLPGCYQPHDSTQKISDRIPTRAEEGLPEGAYVYCCFNNNYKITPEIFDVWMEILKEVPDSVLWLYEGNAAAPVNLRKEAEQRGVDPSRLIFAKKKPIEEHLARHQLADLFLDTIPCNAHTTARDALIAGLPVLTIMGDTFASRVAASIGQTADGGVYVAESIAKYRNYALSKPVIEFTMNDRSEFNDDFMQILERVYSLKAMKSHRLNFSHSNNNSLLRSRLERLRVYAENAVTVFCAVWHKDPKRWVLMEDHFNCLKRQTLKPETVLYVLDGADELPKALDYLSPYVFQVDEALSIYEAWSLAVSLSDTPLVLNLNLDDRLLPWGLELMASKLIASNSDLVGGDWLVAFSDRERDFYLENSADSDCGIDVPVIQSWPPSKKNSPQKLGVGHVPNGTYGPSCLFRRLAKMTYPWKFENGEPIKSIGDAIFWSYLRQKGYSSQKITDVVGVYLSSPNTQAEFRENSDKDYLRKGIKPVFKEYSYIPPSTKLSGVTAQLSSHVGAFYETGKAFKAFSNDLCRWVKASELVERVIQKKNSSVCHIVASGPTAPKSLDYIGSEHDFFTVNFGALNRVPSRFHFVETASYNPATEPCVRDALLMAELVKADHLRNALVTFKNLWMGNLDPEFVEARYQSIDWCATADILFPGLSSLQMQGRCCEIVNIGFDKVLNSEFLIQMHSTTITALQVAFFSGYQKVVFHGFDGGGGTFFQSDEAFEGLLNPAEARHLIQSNSGMHKVGGPALKLMPFIRDYLLSHNIECFSGSEESPLSSYLPVF